ncbi:TetR family transcriptional regulator [Nakamurella sp. YIM 132087]|uniref:TetR family transcriptional regulator n=1 Tax=Nakamurella alba TaxID=2665158 RepID=A0A7K1FM77_9ACTN|nr:TetR/AcrR family transcriptional regulator [Nakamurella alba]MTD15170.1 TetR family transcriptional regulator [Nakamurella alba]
MVNARSRTAGSAPARAESASTRRDEILEAASALFAGSGFSATSLKDVADACGILPGSLYHHFESKEAIVVELLDRFHDDQERIGTTALGRLAKGEDRSTQDQLRLLAVEAAANSVRHRAAMTLLFHDPPQRSGERLQQTLRRPDGALEDAYRAVLEQARADGLLRPEIEPELLADQLREAMLHTSLTVFYGDTPPSAVADTVIHVLLHGIARGPVADADLDGSAAMEVAVAAVRSWDEADAEPVADDRVSALLRVARTEFARRGYEGTTVRHIAAAAGIGTGTVFRLTGSKEAMLDWIMAAFQTRITEGYEKVLATDAPAAAKLDALAWFNLHVRNRFDEEFSIQRSWLRLRPPHHTEHGKSLRERADAVGRMIGAAVASGELRGHGPVEVFARCVWDLLWLPPDMYDRYGPDRSQRHYRGTVLRGALVHPA